MLKKLVKNYVINKNVEKTEVLKVLQKTGYKRAKQEIEKLFNNNIPAEIIELLERQFYKEEYLNLAKQMFWEDNKELKEMYLHNMLEIYKNKLNNLYAFEVEYIESEMNSWLSEEPQLNKLFGAIK